MKILNFLRHWTSRKLVPAMAVTEIADIWNYLGIFVIQCDHVVYINKI